MLLIVLAIAGFSRDLLALRRPRSWPRALGLAAACSSRCSSCCSCSSSCCTAGDEQGLVPKNWESSHAGAYVANFVVDRAGRADRRGADLPRARLLAARAVRARGRRSSSSASPSRSSHGLDRGLPRAGALRLRARLAPREDGQRLPRDGRARDVQRDRADRGRAGGLSCCVPMRAAQVVIALAVPRVRARRRGGPGGVPGQGVVGHAAPRRSASPSTRSAPRPPTAGGSATARRPPAGTVTHTFGGGRFSPCSRPTPASTQLAPVTSVALTVVAPSRADYGATVTLRAKVKPQHAGAARR